MNRETRLFIVGAALTTIACLGWAKIISLIKAGDFGDGWDWYISICCAIGAYIGVEIMRESLKK